MLTKVILKEKFTSDNFESIINEYWDDSFKSTAVEFDLSKLEWIANEQTSFLISWINHLWDKKISVTVKFQTSKDVLTSTVIYKKRLMCYQNMISNWNFLNLINSNIKVEEQGINIRGRINNNIPYKEQSLINYSAETFDSDFNMLYGDQLKPFFEFIIKEIKDNTELNYFDNQFLTYSILKEFYSNSCQHAFEENNNEKCYFSINLNKKIERYHGKTLNEKLENRFFERPSEEIPFFKKDENSYHNKSFIEISFFDFGEGISKTISQNYKNEADQNLKLKFDGNHFNQNSDTRALEYAFLLFTSRYEIGRDFTMHDYIPRGLFVIKEIIKKYKGMIIARSNSGKVVFDFSINPFGNIHYRADDSYECVGKGFPGTSITIVLPAINKDYKSKIVSKKNTKLNFPEVKFINVLDLVNITKYNKTIQTEKVETKKRILFFEIFFTNLIDRILSIDNTSKIDNSNDSVKSVDAMYKTENNENLPKQILIMFDFSGIERVNQDIFNKFLYFITYCPFISHDFNVCLFNLIEKDVNSMLLQEEGHLYKSLGFSPKPIPCLHPDFKTSWLGVNDVELEEILTNLWQEDDRKNKVNGDVSHLSSNIIEVEIEDFEHQIYKFKIIINSYFEITNKIYEYHKNSLSKEVNGLGLQFGELIHRNHNYNNVLIKKIDDRTKQRRAFQTSNSLYQEVFLSFVEKLYIKEYRRMISVYLFYNLLYDHNIELEKFEEVTKVITVTLSSQLIGKEFIDIFNQLLKKTTPLKLIPLSNYYDFYTEEPFKEITDKDQVIIANDVISTGNLSRRIEDTLKNKTKIFGIITIVDSRTNREKRTEIKSTLTSLVNKPIKKYKTNPFPSTKPVWINPILNSPTSMSREKSNLKSILQPPIEFINNFKDDSLFKIGNFVNNTVYHSYYLNTSGLIQNEVNNGFPIITQLLSSFKERIMEEQNTSLENDLVDIKRIKKKYFSQKKSDRQIGENATALNYAFSKIENILSKELFEKKQYELFNDKKYQFIDFIFYPFLSSISDIEQNLSPLSIQLRGTKKIDVFPIPRIMTPKGWRFSFPPKFLNEYSRNSKALIIDDGSCTGETIIQMIDSLSFLELSELNVISIFARLEDFQREFLTRIKKIKVKDSDNNYADYKIIPLNVYFGTHFHIPVYSRHTHYINSEKIDLQEIIDYYKNNEEVISIHLDNYINQRLKFLNEPVSVLEESIKLPAKVDKRKMFIVRDIIGNYDSYRLFKEDELSYSNSKTGKHSFSLRDLLEDESGKYSIIAVINHEPSVISTIERIYPEVISEIKTFCLSTLKLESTEEILEIVYLTKALAIIDIKTLLNVSLILDILERVEHMEEDRNHLHIYLSLIFTRELINNKHNQNKEVHLNSLRILLKEIFNTLNEKKYTDKSYYNLIKDLYRQFINNTKSSTTPKLKAIFKVQSYYSLQNININRNDAPSHPNSYLTFTYLANVLSGFLNETPNKEEKEDFIMKAITAFDAISGKLVIPLKEVLNFFSQFYFNNDLNIDTEKYNKIISEFEKLQESLKTGSFYSKTLSSKENTQKTISWIKNFQLNMLRLSSELPQFFKNENVDIRKTVIDVIDEYRLSKEVDIAINIDIPEQINVKLHTYLLRFIIYELLENKSKYAADAEAHIEYFEQDNEFVLKYRQNAPFIQHHEENGLRTIRNIVSKYGGVCIDSISGNFEFKIKFNKILKENLL